MVGLMMKEAFDQYKKEFGQLASFHPLEEFARKEEVPLGTAKSRLRLARRFLRTQLA